MLLSIGIIILLGIIVTKIFDYIKLPSLLGMILVGILIKPILSKDLINISSDIRQIALIVILIRAGLSLDLEDLRKSGMGAILMTFLPAMFEIIGYVIFSRAIFGFSIIDSIILGSIIAAVSPAVVIPRMIKIINENYGNKKGVCQLIMAGASADDIFVIALFGTLINLSISFINIVKIPLSIFSGIILGIVIGYILSKILKKENIATYILLAISFIISNYTPLICVIVIAMTIRRFNKNLAINLMPKYNNLWYIAQIFLFTFVGVSININVLEKSLFNSILIVLICLLFRSIGVVISLIGTKLNNKEKLFCIQAYLPKATVQAAIGAIPLSMGHPHGITILTISVVSILITAPLGAILIDKTYKKLLSKD